MALASASTCSCYRRVAFLFPQDRSVLSYISGRPHVTATTERGASDFTAVQKGATTETCPVVRWCLTHTAAMIIFLLRRFFFLSVTMINGLANRLVRPTYALSVEHFRASSILCALDHYFGVQCTSRSRIFKSKDRTYFLGSFLLG